MAKVLVVGESSDYSTKLAEELRKLGHWVTVAEAKTPAYFDSDIFIPKVLVNCRECHGRGWHEYFPDGIYGPPSHYKCKACQGKGRV